MARSSAAYQTAAGNRSRRMRLEVQQGKTGLKTRLLEMLPVVAFVFLLVIGVLVIQTQAQLSELTLRVQEKQVALSQEMDNYNYYVSQLSSKTNIKAVEEAARSTLGLTKLEAAQITYFTLDTESAVEKPTGKAVQLAGMARRAVRSYAGTEIVK